MQLVAYGAQDVYLTGNPQITFFKVVYRRHTNFSMECIQQTINGGSNWSASNLNVTISRNGDLVSKVYAVSTGGTMTNGFNMFVDVELEIGGQRIDKYDWQWAETYLELSTPESKALGLKAMTGSIGTQGTTGVRNSVQQPLLFYFCRNPGLALPLIALQYHEVKLKFVGAGATTDNAEVWADYIYLDTDERRRFAQVSHEYLIEQLQYVSTLSASNKLNFNHPVKELIWTHAPADVTTQKAKLVLNGHDRFAAQPKEYFQLRQPYDHHSAIPRTNLPISAQVSTGSGVFANAAAAILSLTPDDTTTVGGSATEFAMPTTTSLELTNANVAALGLATGNGSKGQTLALVCTTVGTNDQYTGADPTLGTLYVATVHSVGDVNTAHNGINPGAGAQLIQLNAGGFVDASADAAAFPTAIEKGTADGRFSLYRLNPDNISQARTSRLTEAINVYSFALKPEEHQPSGTCNFSRIDTAKLEYDAAVTGTGNQRIYAVNYNVLRIMSGMGGLAYSN
jgi:hypothetical protein